MNSEEELVVLLDANHQPIGTATKDGVHTEHTPYHLAFSCYVLDENNRVLLTRRALSKQTWPGVWSNSFCGHPAPGESLEEAIVRRAEQELGIVSALELSVVLPSYAYQAQDSSGIRENEFCPVYIARSAQPIEPDPRPEEVDAWQWVNVTDLYAAAEAVDCVFSPWMVDQLRQPGMREALAANQS